MKGLQFVTICSLAVIALAQDEKKVDKAEKSKVSKDTKANTRFLGGALGVNQGFGGGFSQGVGGGFNQGVGTVGFGGVNPGFGGSVGGFNPALGGGFGVGAGIGGFGGGIAVNPGFGGGVAVNPGFGGGINPGFGGGVAVNPGFGAGINPGFGAGLGGVSQTCRRWCRTPQGQAYCCESNNEPDSLPFVKPGLCPPVRPSCPPVRSFAPPQSCSNDSKCVGIDKCCFDTCLQQHVCKPPTGSSGGFGR